MMAQSGHRNAEKDALLREKRSSQTKTQNSETINAKKSVSCFRISVANLCHHNIDPAFSSPAFLVDFVQ